MRVRQLPHRNLDPSLRGMGQLAPDGVRQNGIIILPPWIYPPAAFENVDREAFITIPAIAASPDTTVLTFTVPPGRDGIINKIANVFIGGGFTDGSNDIIWRVQVNNAFVQGYEAINASLGSISNPSTIPGFRVYEQDVISVVVINNPAGINGGVVVAAQRIGARLVGYWYPRSTNEQDEVWI